MAKMIIGLVSWMKSFMVCLLKKKETKKEEEKGKKRIDEEMLILIVLFIIFNYLLYTIKEGEKEISVMVFLSRQHRQTATNLTFLTTFELKQ